MNTPNKRNTSKITVGADILAAKKYAGLKRASNPDDYDERYYNGQKCAIYDAFLAGIKYSKNL